MCQATATLITSITPESVHRMNNPVDILELFDRYEPNHRFNTTTPLPILKDHLLRIHDEAASKYRQLTA